VCSRVPAVLVVLGCVGTNDRFRGFLLVLQAFANWRTSLTSVTFRRLCCWMRKATSSRRMGRASWSRTARCALCCHEWDQCNAMWVVVTFGRVVGGQGTDFPWKALPLWETLSSVETFNSRAGPVALSNTSHQYYGSVLCSNPSRDGFGLLVMCVLGQRVGAILMGSLVALRCATDCSLEARGPNLCKSLFRNFVPCTTPSTRPMGPSSKSSTSHRMATRTSTTNLCAANPGWPCRSKLR